MRIRLYKQSFTRYKYNEADFLLIDLFQILSPQSFASSIYEPSLKDERNQMLFVPFYVFNIFQATQESMICVRPPPPAAAQCAAGATSKLSIENKKETTTVFSFFMFQNIYIKI